MDEHSGFDRLADAAGVSRLSSCDEGELETPFMRMDARVLISGEGRNREHRLKIKTDEKKFEDLKTEAQEPWALPSIDPVRFLFDFNPARTLEFSYP